MSYEHRCSLLTWQTLEKRREFLSLVQCYKIRCYPLAIASSSERLRFQRENKEKTSKKILYNHLGKPLYAPVDTDVIGCRQMVTRVQSSEAFVPAGGEPDFLARCWRVTVSTKPIREADEIQDLAREMLR